MDNFLNVRMASSCSNLLEGGLDFKSTFHFTLHFSFHERTPQTLRQKVFTHLTFVGVAVLCGSSFCDLLLILNTNSSSVNCLSLVSNTLLKGVVSLLTLSIVKCNLLNLVTHLLMVLSLLLFSTTVLFSFFFHNCYFTLVTFVLIISFNLLSNHVASHTVDHVLVSALEHKFVVVLCLDCCKRILRSSLHVVSVIKLIIELLLLLIGFIERVLHSFEFTLFS